jgi:hypothetical protein
MQCKSGELTAGGNEVSTTLGNQQRSFYIYIYIRYLNIYTPYIVASLFIFSKKVSSRSLSLFAAAVHSVSCMKLAAEIN